MSTELNHTWIIDTQAPVFMSGTTTWKGEQGGGQVTQESLTFKEPIVAASWVETSGSGVTLGHISYQDSVVKYDMSYDASTVP